MTFLCREASAAYRELLPLHLDTTRAAVEASWKTLRFEGRPVCTTLEPLFLDKTAYERGLRDAENVYAALVRTARHVAARGGFSARAKDLLAQMNGPGVLISRLDALPIGGRLEFIELNTVDATGSSPYGIADIDPLNALFSDLPIMAALRQRGFTMGSVDHVRTMVDAVFEAFGERGHEGAPRIAVVDVSRGVVSSSSELLTTDAYLMRLIGALFERGCQFRVCDVSTLGIADEQLVTEGEAIDYVVLADETGAYLDTCADDAPLLVALRRGWVDFADAYPLGSLLRDKALFADLSDPASGVDLTEELRTVVDRCVPWTRRCAKGRTTFEGEAVDLPSFIVDRREHLVLKPTNEIGGKNVSLGWETEKGAWEAALANALESGGFIVQERVVGEKTEMSFIAAGEVVTRDVYFDIDPYVWNGKTAKGVWMRLSEAALLNMSAGNGSETAGFVVEALP